MRDFRFRCLPGCTACCRIKGYVYLSEGDLKRAAAYLGMTAREFEARYIYRTKNFLRLRKPRHADCHFLEADGCRIHPVKPTQCRLFPFWPELVGDREAWREAAGFCPGIGQGPAVQLETAIRLANEMREAYPPMYEGKSRLVRPVFRQVSAGRQNLGAPGRPAH